MNAEKILIKTLLGDTEYRSVLFDVEPGMLPRGITTPGNVRFKVEDMTMFEEVYDAYMEEMKAAMDRAIERAKEAGETTLTLEGIPQATHTLAVIAYAVYFFGWAKMPDMLKAIQRDYVGCDELKAQIASVPAYGQGDEFQDSLGLQIAGEFNKRVTAAGLEAVTPMN